MITLLQLDYFRKLAQAEHITNTARELFISQTALSSVIISLERELGTALFDRSRRSIRLNEAGRTYLRYVNEIFAALENGSAALRDLSEEREKNITLAMGSSLVWAPMLHAFHQVHPTYVLRQSNYSSDKLNQALQEGSVDYVIAGEADIHADGLERCHIKDDGIYLCVAANHPFASRDAVSLSELKEENFINLPAGFPWREYCDRLLAEAGIQTRSTIECDYTMRGHLLESGFGVALTTSTAKEIDLLKPNRYIRISDAAAFRPMYLFWNPRRYISHAALDFKEFCVDYYKDAEQ